MGLGIIRLLNRFLYSRGLEIRNRDEYFERLALVNDKWIQELNIVNILDVGASTGGYAKKARKAYPNARIISFEPLPTSFTKLQAAFIGDNLHEAYNFVLSDTKGSMEFFESSNSGSSSILVMAETHKEAYPHTAENKPIQVSSDTLDNIFAGLNLKGNILLKLDVQGAESMVLRGAKESLEKIKVVYVETSFTELYKGQWLFDDLYCFMKEQGFKLAGVENISQSLKDGSFLQMDVYFVRSN